MGCRVLWADVDATAAALAGVAVVRDAEVNTNLITWPSGISSTNKDKGTDELRALGVIVR